MADEHEIDVQLVAVLNELLDAVYQAKQDWFWCYTDDLFFEVDGARPAPSHP